MIKFIKTFINQKFRIFNYIKRIIKLPKKIKLMLLEYNSLFYKLLILLFFFKSLISNKSNIIYNNQKYLNHSFIYKNNDNLTQKNFYFSNIIYLDNEYCLFEENIDYSNYTTDIKAIALYLPQFHFINENDKWWGKNFTEWTNVKKAKPLYKGHHQPRKPGDEKGYLGYYYLNNVEIIKKQVQLAKSHGIYGFGFYYYWFSGKKLLEKPLNIYLENKDIKFPFLLIWANENWSRLWNGGDQKILIKQEYKKNDPDNFIKDIKKYLFDKRYIKIINKSVIGIYEPFKIPNITKMISIWRKKSIDYKIGELFILVCLNHYSINSIKSLNLFDGAYDFPPRNIEFPEKNIFYKTLIYKNIKFYNITNDFFLFRGSMLEWDNTARRGNSSVIFKEYSPEKFYILNKILIIWTKTNFNNTNKFIFINAWNEWGEGSYLEPDEKYGYASINALSKSLFNLSYSRININILNFDKTSKIIILANIYDDNLLGEIINKTNNIPYKFDLFIVTSSLIKKKKIEKYIMKYSKAFDYLVKINKKYYINIFSFLELKIKIKKYKYICHIYSSFQSSFFDVHLFKSLNNNLLGKGDNILEILYDFEKTNQLGIIFPELFNISLICYENYTKKIDKFYINKIINNIFPNLKILIENISVFPIGNMFWAKIEAIYQIFNIKLIEKPNKFYNSLIIILLYIVKLNGYSYKKNFKYFPQ